jgi:hypothetical protein
MATVKNVYATIKQKTKTHIVQGKRLMGEELF